MPFFDERTEGKGRFDAGIEQVIAAVLVSPEFLYRAIKRAASGTSDGGDRSFPLNDLELASRLSFFLWSQGPDDALLEVGRRRQTEATPACCSAQALRMLKDPRAASLVRNFALKWLDLDKLDEVAARSESVSRRSTTSCGRTWPPRSNRSWRASCSRIATSATCSPPTTRSSTSGWRATTASASVLGPQFRRVTLDDPRALGAARQGRRAAAHVVRQSHVAGAARRVGPGQADGHAADAAAAGRGHGPVARRRASRRRRCARGSSSIARSRAAISATA